MSGEPGQNNNIDRLLAHLDDESFAAKLVRTHRDSGRDGVAEGLKTVLVERLEQWKVKLDGGTN